MKRLKCVMCGGDIIADEEQASAVCPFCGNIQRVVILSTDRSVDRELLYVQAADAAAKERSAVGAMRSNWEGRLAGIDIEMEKRQSENTACVLKAQKTEQQFKGHCIACCVLLLAAAASALFFKWYIFAGILGVLMLLILALRIKTLVGCKGILAGFGRTKRAFDTISDPLLAGEKIRKANPQRLRQIIDENNAYMEQLNAERAEVEHRIGLFSRYLNHPEKDVTDCIFAMRCAEAGEKVPTDEVFRAVRDKALSEMKTVNYGSTKTF